MSESVAAAIAVNRFGLGARPGELAAASHDPRQWLLRQLDGEPPELKDSRLQGSAEILSQAWNLRREAGSAGAGGGDEREARPASANAAQQLMRFYRRIYVAEATARVRHAVTTDRSFLERLTHFWTNHFAVSVDKLAVLGLAGSLEREAVRPNVLGTFADLLLAVERHPAMLFYLDNPRSVGPDSPAARAMRRRRGRDAGLNENLAREILELHTLGVDGGYAQADVIALAQMLTGWSINGERGRFEFRPAMHEPGARKLLGRRYADAGYEQAEAALRDLAVHPSTARHVARRLACHFIADDPSAAAVERIANAFLESRGDLPTVYRALIDTPEAWERPLPKYKTPSDYIISGFRGLQLPVVSDRHLLGSFELLGQQIYAPGSPAGWPDRSADWDGAWALMRRIEWADAIGQRLGSQRNAARLAPQLLGANLREETRKALAHAASGAQALTLLLVSPEFLRR